MLTAILNSIYRELIRASLSGAKITGERYHALYVDDALDARDAFSDAEVEGVAQWWDNSFYNRIADERTSTRCVIGQRLREDDLPGHLLERDGLSMWEWLCIPQLWDQESEDTRRTTGLGWTDPRTYVRPAEGQPAPQPLERPPPVPY